MKSLAVLIALCLVGSSVGSTVTWTFYNDNAANCGTVGGPSTPNPVTGIPQNTCTRVYNVPGAQPAEVFAKIVCSATTNFTATTFSDSSCYRVALKLLRQSPIHLECACPKVFPA